MRSSIKAYFGVLFQMSRSRLAVSMGVTMAGSLTSATFNLMAIGILAHLLSTREFGYFAVFVSLMEITAVLATLGLNNTVVRYVAANRKQQLQPIVLRCLVIEIGLIVLVGAALFVLRGRFMDIQGIPPEYARLFPYAVIAGLCLPLHGLSMAVLQGLGRFTLLACLSAAINGLRVLLIGTLFFLGIKDVAVVTNFYFVPVLLVALLSGAISWRPVRASRTFAETSSSYQELLKFTAPIAVLQVVNVLIARLPTFLLMAMTTSEAVAGYELARQTARIIPLFTRTLFTVLLPEVSNIKSIPRLRDYRNRVFHVYPVILAATLVAMIVCPVLLRIIFGDKYAQVTSIICILLLSLGIGLIVNPLSVIFYAVGRPHYVTMIHVAQLVFLVPLNYILIPRHAGLGAAISWVVITVFAVVAATLLSARVISIEKTPAAVMT